MRRQNLWQRVWPAGFFAIAALCLVGCESGGRISGFGQSSSEEMWGIRCITLNTPDRYQRGEAYAKALKRVAGLEPNLVQVFHEEGETAVYYGRYRRVYGTDASARFKPNHLRDIETIRSLRFQGDDVWPFILASMDVLPTYRSHRPSWNLENVDGYWTLHVAVFYNTATMRSRRTAAEEYCQMLRDRGEEAYFHHGTVNSSVYLGTFPKGAVTEVQRENPMTGEVVTTLKIVEPALIALQKRYPHSLHNGHKFYEIVRNRRTGAVDSRLEAPSFPVVMPKAAAQERSLGGF